MSADMSRQHTLENTSVTGLFRSPMNYGEQRVGGWGGIRTHEGLLTLTPLAGERLQPLGHPSKGPREFLVAGGPLHSRRPSADQAAWGMVLGMDDQRSDSEAYIRRLVATVEAAEAAGISTPQALADLLNDQGVTSRKGRPWTAITMERFLNSPGAERYRSGGAGTD
jgi:hypothetical protein